MSMTKHATEVPAPQVPGAPIWIAENAISIGTYTIPNARPIPQGTTGELPAFLCENAARLDLGARHGAGAYGIAYGLVASNGGGLIVEVTAGQAMIDGVVELYEDATIVVGVSTTSFIWFKLDGTLEVRVSLTPPAQPAVLIAVVTTDASAITSVEFAGVVYLRSGVPERETADIGPPLDTPDETWRGWTKTQSGLWWWDGAAYQRLVNDVPFVRDEIEGSVHIPEDHQQMWFGSLTISGTLRVGGRVRVVA